MVSIFFTCRDVFPMSMHYLRVFSPFAELKEEIFYFLIYSFHFYNLFLFRTLPSCSSSEWFAAVSPWYLVMADPQTLLPVEV